MIELMHASVCHLLIIPEQPSHGKAKLRCNKPVGQSELAARKWELRHHFSQRRHDCEEQRAHDEVREQKACWASILKI